MILSNVFLSANPGLALQENLITWEAEPSAENLHLDIVKH